MWIDVYDCVCVRARVRVCVWSSACVSIYLGLEEFLFVFLDSLPYSIKLSLTLLVH